MVVQAGDRAWRDSRSDQREPKPGEQRGERGLEQKLHQELAGAGLAVGAEEIDGRKCAGRRVRRKLVGSIAEEATIPVIRTGVDQDLLLGLDRDPAREKGLTARRSRIGTGVQS